MWLPCKSLNGFYDVLLVFNTPLLGEYFYITVHRSNSPGGHAEIFVLAKGVFALGRAQNEESFAISNISETITSSVLKGAIGKNCILLTETPF